MDELEKKNIQKRFLYNSHGRQDWPEKGVYFFFEDTEYRTDSGSGLRITRVGTHALKNNSKTTLWKRLSQHKGIIKNGAGNHRGSIFRLLVGTAIMKDRNINISTWRQKNNISKDIKENEFQLEKLVSQTIRKMPFLCLSINDESSPESLRGYIERNSIALLSNFNKEPLDSASKNWLGYKCDREKIRKSNLWNQNHVEETYDPQFLIILEKLVNDMKTMV